MLFFTHKKRRKLKPNDSRKDIYSLYMLVFRSFVFSFVNKLRAGRMNAITNKSRILCLVCSMFMLHVPFYSFLSIYFSSQLNANLHDFQRLLYWTVSAFALHLTLLPLSVSSVETGLNLHSAFAFKHFWLTLKWQCAYTIFSNWLEFQWKHIIILYIEFEWAWAMRWWWWWRRWWVCIYSFISLDQNSFIWPEWKQSSQNCVQGCVCVCVCEW